jgi:hypothetical protein
MEKNSRSCLSVPFCIFPQNCEPVSLASLRVTSRFWPSFLKRNAAWLAGKEVSLTLSRGNAQEANTLLKSLSHDPRLVVATYKGGPITILEPASASSGANPTPP